MSERKIFIVDTSVLLYDKEAIHSFGNNDVILPIVVLDELDRFKDKKGLVGENARYVNRFLDELRKEGSLHTGVGLESGQTIKVLLKDKKAPTGLDSSEADNRMIGLALEVIESNNQPVILVTKDINFRVKCDALGITSEDYYKDRIAESKDELYTGSVEIELATDELIEQFYAEEGLMTSQVESELGQKFYENQFICLKYQQKSMLGCNIHKRIRPLISKKEIYEKYTAITARSREQQYALNLLCRDEIKLVSLTGLAGSGKTYLTLMTGLAGIGAGKYDRIVITRNIQPVGRDIGFLPGDLNEKMTPWIAPIMDNFRVGTSDNNLKEFNAMIANGTLEIAPLAYMRGRTFNRTFMILDEAQNASIHELKTVITRVGDGSKIVLLGDVDQIDTPYIDTLSNGLTVVAEKFKNAAIAGHVTLVKGERSELATIASKII